MKRIQDGLSDFFSLFLLAIISYISFSAAEAIRPIATLFLSAVAVAVLYKFDGRRLFYLSIAGVFAYFAVYYFETDIHDLNSIYNAVIGAANLYLPACTLCICIKKTQFRLRELVYTVSSANIAVTLISLAKIKFADGVNLSNTLNESFDNITDAYMDIITQNMYTPEIDISQIKAVIDSLGEIFVMLVPSMYIIACIIISYILIVISKAVIKAYYHENLVNIERFFQISAKRELGIFTLLVLFVSMITQSSYLRAGIYNFLCIAFFIYFVNGLAVANFFIIKKLRNTFLAGLLTAVLVMAAFMTAATMPAINGVSILFLAGITDSSFNFRRLRKIR